MLRCYNVNVINTFLLLYTLFFKLENYIFRYITFLDTDFLVSLQHVLSDIFFKVIIVLN